MVRLPVVRVAWPAAGCLVNIYIPRLCKGQFYEHHVEVITAGRSVNCHCPNPGLALWSQMGVLGPVTAMRERKMRPLNSAWGSRACRVALGLNSGLYAC
jgi:hypothetical protein